MYDNQRLIIDFLNANDGQASYSDIHNFMKKHFKTNQDIHNTLFKLIALKLINENVSNTFYKLTYPNIKIIYSIPHVILFCSNINEPKLIIESYELFDTFDDLLTEQFDISNYSITTEDGGTKKIVTIHFPINTDLIKLNMAVQSIDSIEVERIYNFNNTI